MVTWRGENFPPAPPPSPGVVRGRCQICTRFTVVPAVFSREKEEHRRRETVLLLPPSTWAAVNSAGLSSSAEKNDVLFRSLSREVSVTATLPLDEDSPKWFWPQCHCFAWRVCFGRWRPADSEMAVSSEYSTGAVYERWSTSRSLRLFLSIFQPNPRDLKWRFENYNNFVFCQWHVIILASS